MSKTETIVIQAEEKYGVQCLNDDMDNVNTSIRKPQGRVEIYEVDEKGLQNLVGKSNLVVYTGRELIAQQIVKTDNINADALKEEFISWLGVGKGGADPSDPFDPIPPINNDTNLYEEVPVSDTDTNCGDFRGGHYYKLPIDSVAFEQDTANDDSWLIVRIVTTIGVLHAQDEQINEAGLFTALENVPGYSGDFHLFARVTFPTILKTSTRQLLFVWYLYT